MSMKRLLMGVFSCIVGVAAFLGAPTLSARQAPPSSLRVTSVTTPAAEDSAEPQLTASARNVLLSWIEHEGPKMTLKFAERTADRWTTPRVVASGTDWSVNAMDVPSVIRLA